MLRDAELRILMYNTVAVILVYVSVIIINYAQTKWKRSILTTPSHMAVNKFKPLAQKNKLFKPLASETFWACLEILFVSLCQYLSFSYLATGFANLVGTGINFFGPVFFSPIILTVIFIILWADPLKQMDFFAMAVPVVLTFNKIGCFCAGCCNGIWWPGGLYNYKTEREEIPVQLIEAGCALLIFVVLVIYKNKAKKRKHGTIYPLFMILLGATRFVSEFCRGQKMVWGPLRVYHILCLISVVLGFIYLFIVWKYGEKISQYFDNTVYFKKIQKKKR